jgi:hypothetical protein
MKLCVGVPLVNVFPSHGTFSEWVKYSNSAINYIKYV